MKLLLCQKFTGKSIDERILKIDQQVTKLDPKVEWRHGTCCLETVMYNKHLHFC